VFIRGESGSGKTALCETFARQLTEHKAAVVLRARCYERESVPFKALDPLIDALGRHLRRLPPHEAATILPREVFALAKLFPALERIAQVAELPSTSIPDPRELRSRAFAALGEWLSRIRLQQPVLVYIDDLQWACADSIAGLSLLLAAREIAPLLIVLTNRCDFQNLRQVASENPELSVHELRLG
jgi:predicted ATPase